MTTFITNSYNEKLGPVGPNPYLGVIGNYGDTGPAEPKCRKYKGFLPSFTPEINSLSTYTSKAGLYKTVFINGLNFLPSGTTYVNFGPFTNLQVSYYSSFNISFVIPLKANVGTYKIVVVNVYNGNFSPRVNITGAGVLNYSNSVQYTLTLN